MTLTVVSTNVAEPRHARVIEVFATGSHGGSHEWTVDFNRNGTIWAAIVISRISAMLRPCDPSGDNSRRESVL